MSAGRGIESADFTCPHCHRTGKVAKSLIESGRPVTVKHSATMGGCGMTVTINK